MELAAIFHRPNDNYVYAMDSETLHIRLQTKMGEITSVLLFHGDQYEWKDGNWVVHESAMFLSGSDGVYDYWHIYIKPESRRSRYGFRIKTAQEEITLTEKGFYPEPPLNPGCYYHFPYLHRTEVFTPPAWVKETVWYQIFPERFANGSSEINPEGVKEWASEEPALDNFFGGDFEGVIERLDYLKDLGITGIYFTPVFKAPSNHKYETIDYLEIDPQFGSKETLKKLVSEAHLRGIRVMLDAVFNHSGFYFPPFQDVLHKGEQSKYKDWFHPHSFPLEGGDRPNYETFGFFDQMPKLNTYNPEVKEYLLKVAAYWIEEFDIDGWRLDVANEVDHQFWREFRQTVKKIKPDLYILGEVWHDAMPWLRGDQFDAVMNYPFTSNILDLLAHQTITARMFADKMSAVYHSYPKNVFDVTFNLVGSHDTPRILTECGEDEQRTKLIFTILLTFMGSPCIYYGDEVGLTGEMDPGCRKCMEWDADKQNLNLFQHIQSLIHLRHTEKLLANEGEFEFIDTSSNEQILGYRKYSQDRSVIVLANPTEERQQFTLPPSLLGMTATVLSSSSEQKISSETDTFDIERFGHIIVSLDK
ncbi:glycoside hydrolase family 13 protein [Peribacillus sp. SCS-155]|uniref:glycoside hydrolase family 13 protein n=1 Tax=Peribacillus sedimenti TaxID=3115297 RepID=UPI0039062069